MKQSTLGIGIAFLVFALGTGIWFCSADNLDNFFSPGERQIACAGELSIDDGALPSVPEPLPLESPAAPHDPWAVNEPRYAPVSYTKKVEPASEPEEPDYLIRGQLTHKETDRTNPLRGEEDEQPQPLPKTLPPRALPSKKVPVEPVAQPLPAPNPISQTAMQVDRGGFADPVPPGREESILEPVGFPTTPSNAPQPQPTVQPPVQPEPLRSADPFAVQSHPGAVPPIVSSPKPPREAPVAPAAPIAAGRANPVDRPTLATARPMDSFAQPVTRSMEDTPVPRSSSLNEGTGMPGASALEGRQTPHLTVEKILPAEIVVEQPATIKLKIRNVGQSPAKKITVRDRVPQGARLLSTTPETTPNDNGELLWSLGSLEPNEELTVEMRLLPLREGEIGSVASVNYSAEASARIQVSRPMLKIEVSAPTEVKLGEVVNLEIAISNPGSATASGIVLVEHIPDGLYHRDGKVLENRKIDTLKPREKKVLVLPLTCTGPGNLINHVVVTANNNLKVEDKTTIRALAPILNLNIAGPRQRFLERPATYRLVVSNSGTASAQNVDLKVALPEAVKFVSTNQSGVYEAKSHTVHWALEELPSQEAGEIELVLMPTKIGEHALQFTGVGQNNLKAEDVKTMTIDGIPALSFEVVGSSNLVEVGRDVMYEIRVANKGTKGAHNVKVQATLSEGMSIVNVDGAANQARGRVVAFSPLAQLDARGEKVFKFSARCNVEGDHRINVQLISDDLASPITKEESTRAFQ